MMDDAAVFSVLSKCFGPVDRDEWKQLTRSAAWADFTDGVRRLLQDDSAFGKQASPFERSRARVPLQEFLSVNEVDELFCPPLFEEKQAFEARHFTGGLPQSASPVESLYTDWEVPGKTNPVIGKQKGLYLGASARYMRALIERLGLEVPPAYADCPDHLALELDLVAVLLRSGMDAEARQFLAERFDWLTDYRLKLLSLDDDARFYISLVDVILGICAEQRAEAELAEAGTRRVAS